MVEARPLFGFGWARFTKRQHGLLPAGVRLPADRDEGRRPQHGADLRGRSGARGHDALGRRPRARDRQRAHDARAARPRRLARRAAGDRDGLPGRPQRGAADDVAEPLALAASPASSTAAAIVAAAAARATEPPTSRTHGTHRVPHEPLPGDLARLRAARGRARAGGRRRPAHAVDPPRAPRTICCPRPTATRPRRRSTCCPPAPDACSARTSRRCVRSPRRYLSTLALALRTGAPGSRERLWHLFYFGEAMILLRHCRRARIAHVHAHFADSATDVAMLVAHYRRGQRVDGVDCSWSLAVHGSVEFYDVTPLRADGQARRRALRGGDQRLRPQPAHATQRPASAGRTSTSFGAASTWACTQPPAERPGSDRGRRDPLRRAPAARQGAVAPARGRRDAARARPRRDRDHRRRRTRARGRTRPTRGASASPSTSASSAPSARTRSARHYARADLFCLPSFAEGVPVVAMEAMAMELPVVSTRIMGIPELVRRRRCTGCSWRPVASTS